MSRSVRRYAWILAPLVAVLAVVPLASRATGHPISDFTRDIFSTAEVPIYIGIVSNAGVLLWGATVAICFFAWAATPPHAARGLLLCTAGLTTVLTLDDFFMLHEWVFPRVTGLDEKMILGVYAVAFGAYLVVFRRAILAAGPGGFAAALALFGLSVGMDLIEPEDAAPWRYLTEEGFKLLGIGVWLGFFWGVALDAVAPGQRSAQATAASKSESPAPFNRRNVSS